MIDPDGRKAKVSISRNKDTKTGTVAIDASFAIYAAEGSNLTEEQLNDQKDLIARKIQETYSGQFKGEDGYEYTVSATITIKVVKNETEAKKSGADNIAELGQGYLMVGTDKIQSSKIGMAYRLAGESFDRMKITQRLPTLLDEGNAYSHEFTHLLGKKGHSNSENDVNGKNMWNPPRLSNNDFKALFGRQIRQRQNEAIRRAPILPRGSVLKWVKSR